MSRPAEEQSPATPAPRGDTGLERWRRILEETAGEPLTASQRFWRTVAFLRTREVQQAVAVFDAGSNDWKRTPRSLILYSEIAAAQGRQHEAGEILERLYREVKGDPELVESWSYAARHLKRPGPHLVALLERAGEREARGNLALTSADDWIRAMSLPANSAQTGNYLDWMDWEIGQAAPPRTLEDIAAAALTHSRPGSSDLHRLYLRLARNECWSFIAWRLLGPATLAAADPHQLWRAWHRRFPRNERDALRRAMRAHLQRRPDWKLEAFLSEYGGPIREEKPQVKIRK